MLYRVNDKPLRDVNEDIDDVKEFKAVGDRKLKWVFLVYDYESRYRKLPLDQRKEKVAVDLKFPMQKGTKKFAPYVVDMINGKDANVERAVSKFKELIYDEDKETYEALRDMISNIRDMIKKPTDDALEMVRKTQLGEKLPSLVMTKSELARIFDIEEDEDENSDNDVVELSTLDLVNDGKI